MKKIISTTFLIHFILLIGISQIKYDFEIDYFPRIKTIGKEANSIAAIKNDGEFIVSIENILKEKLNDRNINLSRISGFTMKNSGLYPKVLAESKMWMMIEIDEDGKTKRLELYNAKGNTLEEESNKIFEQLKLCSILPARRNGKAVGSRLFYKIK